MSRKPKFSGKEEKRVLSLIRQNGLTETQALLAKEGVEVTVGCLCQYAKRAGIQLTRGRSSEITTVKQRRHVAALVKKHGASKTAEILASKDGELAALRSNVQFPAPVAASVAFLCKIAADHGVELRRGRRAA